MIFTNFFQFYSFFFVSIMMVILFGIVFTQFSREKIDSSTFLSLFLVLLGTFIYSILALLASSVNSILLSNLVFGFSFLFIYSLYVIFFKRDIDLNFRYCVYGFLFFIVSILLHFISFMFNLLISYFLVFQSLFLIFFVFNLYFILLNFIIGLHIGSSNDGTDSDLEEKEKK